MNPNSPVNPALQLETQKSNQLQLADEKAQPPSATPSRLSLARLDVEKPPDGGYGWWVILSSFLIHFVVLGGLYTYGVYRQEYKNMYSGKATSATISMVGTLALGLMSGSGVISGRLAEKLGFRVLVIAGSTLYVAGQLLASFSSEIWHLFLTQGVLCGFGTAFAFFPAVSVPSQWFDKKRGLATGMAVSGSGIGGLVLSPLTQYLIRTVGLPNALRYNALLSAVLLTIAILLLRTRLKPKSKSLEQPAAKRPLFDFSLFGNPLFRLMFLNSVCTTFGYLVPFVLIPSYAIYVGLDASQGALLLALMNGASAVGRMAVGRLADRIGNLQALVLTLFFAGSSVLLIWPFSFTFSVLLAFSLAFGFFAGGFISLVPVVAAELFGVQKLASTTGLLYAGGAFGNFLGSPVAEWIIAASPVDAAGRPASYLSGILFSGALIFSGSIILSYAWYLIRKEKLNEAAPSALASEPALNADAIVV